MDSIRLLSTDFDGTLVGIEHGARVPAGLADALLRLREAGVLWAVNTGRTLPLLLDGLKERGFPLQPDFALTCEREVFHRTAQGGWEDFGDWNHRCREVHRGLFERIAPFFKRLGERLRGMPGVTMVVDKSGPSGLIAQTVDDLDHAVKLLEEHREVCPDFHYQRNFVYLRFCHADYHKGRALAELGRLLEIPRERIFAAGDNLNDLSMLDGSVAAHVACPSNSHPDVIRMVRSAGGYVASAPAGLGTLEALEQEKIARLLAKADPLLSGC